MAIILSPDLLGIEGQTHEATAAVVKLNGVELGDNAIRSITSFGWSSEGVENNFALGNPQIVSYTNGVIVPRDITITVYVAAAEIIKTIISPIGKYALTKFNLTIQLDAPDSQFPGVAGLISLPTLTTSISGCKLIGESTGVEAGGASVMNEWTVKPLRIESAAGTGI
jgi:hypothetical protein